MKVLHIVESLGSNAVETWLVNTLEMAHSRGVKLYWTFLCQSGVNGAKASFVESLGARVVVPPYRLSNPIHFILWLRREIRLGKYDCIHGHHDILNGLYFMAGAGLGLRTVCHIHNADETVPARGRAKCVLLRFFLRRLTLLLSDKVAGNSRHVLAKFIRGRRPRPGVDLVCYYGVSIRPRIAASASVAQFKSSLGIRADAKIAIFASRIVPEKSPLLAMRIFHSLCARIEGLFLVVAGEGPLVAAMHDFAENNNCLGRVRFLGFREDVRDIMSFSDLFILARPDDPPEGFGLAVLEAQLAGLPLLISTGISDDVLLESATFRRLLPDAPLDQWAAAGVDLLSAPRPDASIASWEARMRGFDRESGLNNLLSIYED